MITIAIPPSVPAPVLRLLLAVAAYAKPQGVTTSEQSRAANGRFVRVSAPIVGMPRVLQWPMGAREIWTVCCSSLNPLHQSPPAPLASGHEASLASRRDADVPTVVSLQTQAGGSGDGAAGSFWRRGCR